VRIETFNTAVPRVDDAARAERGDVTNTITMNGNATGYGASSGSESFVLYGYQNTVLLAGANDSITLAGGGLDVLNLNATGFTGATTDTINLGAGIFDRIMATAALQDSSVSVTGGAGETTLTLANHGGTTVLDLGNQGDVVNAAGLGANDSITLNGDATNAVSFTSGDGADVAIGTAGDGFTDYNSSVALFGLYNLVTGGDENFAVTDASGSNVVTLGNGSNTVTLGGSQNSVSYGAGDNSVAFSGFSNALSAGAGNNNVTSAAGGLTARFAAGGAGQNDTLSLAEYQNSVHGGDENFTITNAHGGAFVDVGNGNNTISLTSGNITLGRSTANTGTNRITTAGGGSKLKLNGGTDQVNLLDAHKGFDQVVLSGTQLGTALTAHGSFDSITLTADANAAITETAVNGGLSLTLDGDTTGGIGDVSVFGLAQDDLAHINLVGLGAYSVTVDNTALGGLTLHFAHGSLDLIGEQSISSHLITG